MNEDWGAGKAPLMVLVPNSPVSPQTDASYPHHQHQPVKVSPLVQVGVITG